MRTALRKKIHDMFLRDQRARFAARRSFGHGPLNLRVRRIDALNRARVRRIVDDYGWPTFAMVGKAAAHEFWLLTQHLDEDRAFQARCLKLMEREAARGQVHPTDLAHLIDRVRINRGQRQVYGTQFIVRRGQRVIAPVQNPARLNERRLQYGLEPLEKSVGFQQKSTQPKAMGKPGAAQRVVRRAVGYLPTKVGAALDLGSGVGNEVEFLVKLGFRVTAVDSQVPAARSSYRRGAHVAYSQDIQKFRIGERQWRIIVASLIWHFLSRNEAMRLLRRVAKGLKRGGVAAFVALGSKDGWAGKVTTYTPEEFRSLVALCGLEVVSIENFERDGKTYAGVGKHWEFIEVIARRSK